MVTSVVSVKGVVPLITGAAKVSEPVEDPLPEPPLPELPPLPPGVSEPLPEPVEEPPVLPLPPVVVPFPSTLRAALTQGEKS